MINEVKLPYKKVFTSGSYMVYFMATFHVVIAGIIFALTQWGNTDLFLIGVAISFFGLGFHYLYRLTVYAYYLYEARHEPLFVKGKWQGETWAESIFKGYLRPNTTKVQSRMFTVYLKTRWDALRRDAWEAEDYGVSWAITRLDKPNVN